MTLATVERYDRDAVDSSGGRAVVVGAGVAGLLAARMLRDAFETVTVIERDSLDEQCGRRPGVPQDSHLHVLLRAGSEILEDVFPGFGEEFRSAGGFVLDWSSEFEYYEQDGWLASGSERVPMYSATRPLFEELVRSRVVQSPEVRLRTGCRLLSYVLEEERRVTGVRYRDGNEECELAADLVVDATGRASKTPAWLERTGFGRPPSEEVCVDLSYATAFIERPPGNRRAIGVLPSPPRTRGGVLLPVEDGRWLLTLWGVHGNRPPTDPDGFVEYAAALPLSAFEEILQEHAWSSDDVAGYPFPSSRRTRYSALEQLPEGLVVLGDALASFNPVYGQGMSVAALETLVLHRALVNEGTESLARRFFERADAVVDDAWRLAVVSDFGYAETTGPKPCASDLLNWYVARLLTRAQQDGSLRSTFGRVSGLEIPVTALLRPGVVWRVFRPRL